MAIHSANTTDEAYDKVVRIIVDNTLKR